MSSECCSDEVTMVITDFEMPIMSGLEAIKEIRAFSLQMNLRLRRAFEIKHKADPEKVVTIKKECK